MPLEIQPDWTLSQLQENYPGVELTLYSHFGIGTRERAGFSGSELLQDLLRRHLVFDAERACRRLTEIAREDFQHSVDCQELKRELDRRNVVVVDARSEQEFIWCHLPGAKLLSHETVQSLLANPTLEVVTVCREGSQSPAAARILRQQNIAARSLRGGLERWSHEIDASFPILFPLTERPGHWYLLADGDTLRFRRRHCKPEYGYRVLDRTLLSQFPAGLELLELLPDLKLLLSSGKTLAVRGLGSGPLSQTISRMSEEILNSLEWDRRGSPSDEQQERLLLERVLAEEAPEILASHKGTVIVESYEDRVLTLALGGGCAGCASAQITTQRELAASLYRAVPLLDSIRNSSEAQ